MKLAGALVCESWKVALAVVYKSVEERFSPAFRYGVLNSPVLFMVGVGGMSSSSSIAFMSGVDDDECKAGFLTSSDTIITVFGGERGKQ